MTKKFYGVGYNLGNGEFNVVYATNTLKEAFQVIKEENDPELVPLKIVATYSLHKLVSETITEI